MRKKIESICGRPVLSFDDPEELLRRIYERVEPDLFGGCWLWSGSTQRYGVIKIEGRSHHVHRAVYMAEHRVRLSPDTVVRHKCDVTACCNPHHLKEGTQADNVADMVSRGRSGTRPGRTPWKTSPDMRESVLQDHRSCSVLATIHGVSASTIHNIRKEGRDGLDR